MRQTTTGDRCHRFATVLTILVAIVAALVVALPADAAPTVQLGVHAGQPPGASLSMPERVQSYEDLVGRDVTVANVFHNFSDTWVAQTAPNGAPTEEQQLLDAGHTLMVSWRATDASDSAVERATRATELAAGLHDATLKEMAHGLAQLDGRVLVRFNWEMDQDAPDRQYIGSPAEFIAAWRHVHDVVSAIAPAVEWVWAPRANSFNKGIGQQYWPGGAYVDLVAGSAVPLASSGEEGAWRGPGAIYGGVVDFARARSRPLLVWIGVREKDHDPELDPAIVHWEDDPTWKAGFINDLHTLAAGEWRDVLHVLLWYHSVSPKGFDFRADTSTGSLRAMRSLVCDAAFGGCGGSSDGTTSTGGTTSSSGTTSSGGASEPGKHYFLSNTLRGGPADEAFGYGLADDEVLVGDWDSDRVDTLGVRRGAWFYLSNHFRGGRADIVFRYGVEGDEVFVGDWDGDGDDTFAVRRGATFYVTNSLRGGRAEAVFTYGRHGDVVLVGDWDGDGDDTFAVRRAATYYVSNRLRGGNADIVFRYGRSDDLVHVGDWDGDGDDTLAVRRAATYYVNNRLRGGNADIVFRYGWASDISLVGDWDGDDGDTFGVRRVAAP